MLRMLWKVRTACEIVRLTSAGSADAVRHVHRILVQRCDQMSRKLGIQVIPLPGAADSV